MIHRRVADNLSAIGRQTAAHKGSPTDGARKLNTLNNGHYETLGASCPPVLPWLRLISLRRTMGKLEGRVAFITGAARGQGRSHAVRLAQEGADVIAIDICGPIDSVPYRLSTPEDLAQTVKEVEAQGRRAVGGQADVRDLGSLRRAYEAGIAELGTPDIIVANAGIAPMSVEGNASDWNDTIAVNLTGVFNTVHIAIPGLINRGGGAIVLISSTAGLVGTGGNTPGMLAYTASKHGVVGLTRAWANYLAPHNIRVNAIAPGGVRTPMVVNDALPKFAKAHPEFANSMGSGMPGVDMVESIDVSNAIAWLVSEEARYVTGVIVPVDGGAANKH
jgi:SDR family mycofactocin-dependent oxidoreductase